MNQALLQVESSTQQKEVIAWLAPSAHEIGYFKEDLNGARQSRHPNSCRWLHAKNEFQEFQRQKNSLLWIYAQPGAGKTILSSFIVDEFQSKYESDCVLYFFCKEADSDKNTAVAIVKSLTYQLYQILRM